jgi:hypothetical protein
LGPFRLARHDKWWRLNRRPLKAGSTPASAALKPKLLGIRVSCQGFAEQSARDFRIRFRLTAVQFFAKVLSKRLGGTYVDHGRYVLVGRAQSRKFFDQQSLLVRWL